MTGEVTYATKDVIRAISGLSTTEISDDDLSGLCSVAVSLFNAEVNVQVGYGDDEYELLIPDPMDDTDTKFYTQHCPLADQDGDATIGVTADVLVWDDLKEFSGATCAISAIDYKTGKITLVTPITDSVYAQYAYTAKEYESVEFATAFAYFVTAMAWDRLIGTAESVSANNMSVTRKNYFRDRWLAAKSKLTSGLLISCEDTKPHFTDKGRFKDPDAMESD